MNAKINFDLAVLLSEASTPNFYIMLFIEEEQGSCATYTLSGSCATIFLLLLLLLLRLFALLEQRMRTVNELLPSFSRPGQLLELVQLAECGESGETTRG